MADALQEILVLRPSSEFLDPALDREFHCLRPYLAADPDAVIRAASHVTALVTTGSYGVPDALWSLLPNLGLVAVHGVGLDRVDVPRAEALGVRIATTPDALTDDVADLAIGLWLAASRRMGEGERYIRARAWPSTPAPALSVRASGRRVGVLGFGRIGKAIADRARVFASEVRYFNRSAVPGRDEQAMPTLIELASWSEVLFVAASNAPGSRPLIDGPVLKALGPDALLINVARGAVVDEPALVEALKFGRLGGAGLDVFADEPNVPADLLALDNVVLQPHRGSATREGRQAMADEVLQALRSHFELSHLD
ncbi:2-hydroxyacid dehydrogenase [Caulobacter segnis]|nr:2-hydroxyacid dehydrogenase [Caulobacter segnis]MDG2520246.1 2-hydroxyacid dehydrogenase [Caulobacter segnis]